MIVVDVGILGERGHRAIGVGGVDRGDVFGDDPRQVCLFHTLVSQFVAGAVLHR